MTYMDELITKAKNGNISSAEKWRLIDIFKEIPARVSTDKLLSLCPFHEEQTPSFIIDKETKAFRCLGCGEAGVIKTYEQLIKENQDKHYL